MSGNAAKNQQPDNGLYGLLQFNCGLPTPFMPDHDAFDGPRAIRVGDVRERRRSLRSWLVPPSGRFQLEGITSAAMGLRSTVPEHTWLIELSRHAALEMPIRSVGQAAGELPSALDWSDPRDPTARQSTYYIRVQRARDDTSRSLTSVTDCNDYFVREASDDVAGPGSLSELQLFFAEFLAERRGAIFASHVSERIYTIWLPPGVIVKEPGPTEQSSCFALLPVVTLVRRSYRIRWRHAMSVGMLLVPWWPPDAPKSARPRPMTPHEVFEVMAATGGNSTELRHGTNVAWRMTPDSPLQRYLDDVTHDERRYYSSRYRECVGHERKPTLRQWTELLLLAVAEIPVGPEDRKDDRIFPEQQEVDDTILPDEVLRSLRVNGIWSATLTTGALEKCRGESPIQRQSWWPSPVPAAPATVADLAAGVPGPIAELFELFAQRDRAFVPTPEDRVDVLATGGGAHMTWRIPREHIIVTAYSRGAEQFPDFSSLNLASWFSFIAVGVTCAWQTMRSLTHEIEKISDITDISRLGHDRIIDLEDVYDLEVASPAYANFYRRVRDLLGVQREYEDIKDRFNLLFTFARAGQRTRDEHKREEELGLRADDQQQADEYAAVLARIAAIVGAGILFVSAISYLADAYNQPLLLNRFAAILIFLILIFLAAGLVTRYLWRIQKISIARDEIRTKLRHLADPASSSSRSSPRAQAFRARRMPLGRKGRQRRVRP
jgi:hypothetical protein